MADVFVMRSGVEPFGFVAFEGWRSRTVILVSCLRGSPESSARGVRSGRRSFSPRAMADLLSSLLSDRELRDRVAAEGLAEVLNYNWSTITAEYVEASNVSSAGIADLSF